MYLVQIFIKTEVEDEENAKVVPTFPPEETPCIEPVKSERYGTGSQVFFLHFSAWGSLYIRIQVFYLF
jgi:hypothetical protein